MTAGSLPRRYARALFEIACALADTHRFSTVITPNYDEGHRNHFHLDARPDDADSHSAVFAAAG